MDKAFLIHHVFNLAVLVPLFGFTDRLHIKNFFDFSWPTGHDYDAICQIDCFFYSVGNKEDSAWVFTS